MLMEQVAEDSHYVDTLIYPICFNFRHAIELSLKHLNHVLPRIWSEQAPTKWTHKLLDNWTSVRGYLERDRDFDPDGTLVPGVEHVLKEYLRIDGNGEVFRFPSAKSGALHLQEMSVINVERLYDSLEATQVTFDWWDFTAERLWDAQCEMFASG